MMFDIKQDIKSAFKKNKIAICIAAAILFISIFLGYLLEPDLHSYFSPVVEKLTDDIQTGTIQLTFADIFLNNIKIVMFMFVLGILFCFSAVILSFNGFFTGYFIGTSDDLPVTLLLIIPHGIFEFSSCILACASGFVLFNFFYVLVKNFFTIKDSSFLDRVYEAIDESWDKLKEAFILFFIAVILMVIAGIFEVYVTLPFAELVLSLLG